MTKTMQNILRSRTSLLAVALAAATPQMAHAADETADEAAEETADETADKGSPIVVVGRRVSEASEAIGVDRVTNTVAVTRDALLSAPSGISGLKMLETLPGFNVQTDGALGLYEFGNSVQARAFNLDQLGFTVDGIPLGRSDAFGGSPVFRYVDNENLALVEASVGAGDVSVPSYASLGPVVQYRSIAPQDEFGLFVSQSFGDDDMKRTFIRLSSGQVGPLSAYVSRTKLDSDLWRGFGSVDREHWEAQLVADLGGDSWARFKFVANDFFDYDSPSLGRATYLSDVPDLGGKNGRDRGYIDVPPPTAPGFTPTTPGIPYSNPNYTYTYALAVNVRKDKLYGGTFHAGIADGVWAEATLYWEDKDGYGVSPESYSSVLARYTPQLAAGLPVSAPRGTAYGLSGVGGDRYGVTTKLHWEIGANIFEAGVWMETDKYHRTQRRLNTADGSPSSAPLADEIIYFRRDYRSKRDTTQIFVKDTLSLMDDALSLTVGFKGLSVDYMLNGYRDFNDYYRIVGGVGVPGYGHQVGTARYKDFFLPQAGILYKLDGRTQIFASYSQNMAFPKGMDDIYSTTLNSSSAFVPAPAAERAENFELGVRTNQPQFYAALAGYYTKFKNRIQAFSTPLPGAISGTETFFQNVGAVEAYGLELTGSYKPAFLNGLAYFNLNATYNIAKFQDDVITPARTYLLDGKYLPDSAKWIVNGGVTIEPASWLVANISGKYTSKRWSTFDNTPGSTVPGFLLVSAYVDVGDGISAGPLKNVRARFNVDNLFDKDTLSFIGSSLTGDGFFRPLSPRTFQLTVTAEY